MKKSSKESLSKIQKALTRLEASEGRVARKNARLKLAGALRSLEAQVEREFPAISKVKAPLGKSLEEQALRVKPETLDRQIVLLLAAGKQAWNIDLAHAFINWIADACKRHCEPIEMIHTTKGAVQRCNTWQRGLTGGVIFHVSEAASDAWKQVYMLHKLAHIIQEHRRNGQRDLAHSKRFMAIEVELYHRWIEATRWPHDGVWLTTMGLPSCIGEKVSDQEIDEEIALSFQTQEGFDAATGGSSATWKAFAGRQGGA